MAQEEKPLPPTVKKSKHRSPNYPAVGLQKALEKTGVLYEAAKLNHVPVTVAHNLWEYKAGMGDQIVAALKSYGLVEISGEKLARNLQVTDRARKILGGHPDRVRLLQEAALGPTLHRELWERWKGDLPHNDIIKNYLVWQRNFNENFVDGFIDQFRTTIAYAGLTESDKIDSNGDEEAEEESTETAVNARKDVNSGAGSNVQKKPPVLKAGIMYSITIDVLEGGQINVATAGDLNEKTFALVGEVFALKAKHEAKPDELTQQKVVVLSSSDRKAEAPETGLIKTLAREVDSSN